MRKLAGRNPGKDPVNESHGRAGIWARPHFIFVRPSCIRIVDRQRRKTASTNQLVGSTFLALGGVLPRTARRGVVVGPWEQ